MRGWCPWVFLIVMGCNGSEPTKNDIIGTWRNKEGAVLEFHIDSTFRGSGLPDAHFGVSQEDAWSNFSGAGTWSIQVGQQFSEVNLNFKEKNGSVGSFNYQVLVSGSGTFENKTPWYLFLWEYNDVGGARYKFFKVPQEGASL